MAESRDVELTLVRDGQRAVVSPFGASLRRYYHQEDDGREVDVLWGYSGAANKRGGQGDVLIPFPGRVRNGRYSFQGREYQMELNDKEGPNAIHGFVRGVDWEHDRTGDASVVFHAALRAEEYAQRGYPFSLDVEVGYALETSGLVVRFSVRNVGEGLAPVGAGFHPYFTVGTETLGEAEVRIPAGRYLEFDAALLPTGRVLPLEGTPWDFRQARPLGTTRLNHCLTDLLRDADGLARVLLRSPADGREVTVWMDASFAYLVVYTGDAIPEPHARKALAVEPMTCATDALNHPDWGLSVLAPGQVLQGTWGAWAKLP